MPTKDTTVISVRVRNEILEEIKRRVAIRRMKSTNQWLNWAIDRVLKSHSKKDNNE